MPRRRRKPTTPEGPKLSDEDRIIAKYKERITSPLTGIRAHCVECMGGTVSLVAECAAEKCALHPFRMGKNTMHVKYGDPSANQKKKKT